MKRSEDSVGQVLRYDLPDGTSVFGRRLRDGCVGFYGRRGVSLERPPTGSRGYQFVVGVDSAVLRSKKVVALGVDPTLDGEDDYPPPFVIHDVISGRKRIYVRGAMRWAVGDEWVGLETAASWPADALVKRIVREIPVWDNAKNDTGEQVLRHVAEQETVPESDGEPDESWLEIDCESISVRTVVADAGHTPNGVFWEGVALYGFGGVEALEFDCEASTFRASGSSRSISDLAQFLTPLMAEPELILSLLNRAKKHGFDFDD